MANHPPEASNGEAHLPITNRTSSSFSPAAHIKALNKISEVSRPKLVRLRLADTNAGYPQATSRLQFRRRCPH
jgi:hypothetical protein